MSKDTANTAMCLGFLAFTAWAFMHGHPSMGTWSFVCAILCAASV